MNFTYSGSTDATYQTMICIDLYKSKELDSVVVDLVKHHSLHKMKYKNSIEILAAKIAPLLLYG